MKIQVRPSQVDYQILFCQVLCQSAVLSKFILNILNLNFNLKCRIDKMGLNQGHDSSILLHI